MGAGEERRFVLITGLSGAGKTQALHTLEDMGYFAVDNIPLELIPKLLELVRSARPERRAAFVVDCRQDELFGGIPEALQVMRELGIGFDVLYLEADDATLIRRYKETRRSHPLAPGGSVPQGIRLERERLLPARKEATVVLDTSDLTPHQLKERIREIFARDGKPGPNVRLVSFGFKYGPPPDADLVLDVRSLPNPYYDPALSPLPGSDPRIVNFILKEPRSRALLGKIEELLKVYLETLPDEGRAGFVVAVGCTGGRHRSVATVEILKDRLGSDYGTLNVEHRDLGREELPSATS